MEETLTDLMKSIQNSGTGSIKKQILSKESTPKSIFGYNSLSGPAPQTVSKKVPEEESSSEIPEEYKVLRTHF